MATTATVELPTATRDEAMALQRACNEARVATLKVDGVFGPKTAEAVLRLAVFLAARLGP